MNSFIFAVIACLAVSAAAQESSYFFFDNGNFVSVNNATGESQLIKLDVAGVPATALPAAYPALSGQSYTNPVMYKGVIYALDNANFNVIKIDSSKTPWAVTVVAGAGVTGDIDAVGTEARFTNLVGLVVSGTNLAVADLVAATQTKIKTISTTDFTVKTIVSEMTAIIGATGVGGVGDFVDMKAASNGDIYVGGIGTISKVAPDGMVSIVAGTLAGVGALTASDLAATPAVQAKLGQNYKFALSADEKDIWIFQNDVAVNSAYYGSDITVGATITIGKLVLLTGDLTIEQAAVTTALSTDGVVNGAAVLPATNGNIGRVSSVFSAANGQFVLTELGGVATAVTSVVRTYDSETKTLATVSGDLELMILPEAFVLTTSKFLDSAQGAKAESAYQLLTGGFEAVNTCGLLTAPGVEPELSSTASCSGTVAKLNTAAGGAVTISQDTTVSGDSAIAADSTLNVAAPLTVAGLLAANGNSTISIADADVNVGSFTQGAESILVLLIQKATPGFLKSSGAASVAGAFVARIAKGYNFAVGDVFTIITSSALTGKFSKLTLVQLFTRRSALQAGCVTQTASATGITATGAGCPSAGSDDDDEVPYIIALVVLIVACVLAFLVGCCWWYKQDASGATKGEKMYAAADINLSGSSSSSSYGYDNFGAAPFDGDYVYSYSY